MILKTAGHQKTKVEHVLHQGFILSSLFLITIVNEISTKTRIIYTVENDICRWPSKIYI